MNWLKRVFGRTAGEIARRRIESHVRTVVCSLCGTGSETGYPSYLVRIEVDGDKQTKSGKRRTAFYRHGDPRTCVYIMARKRASRPRFSRAAA